MSVQHRNQGRFSPSMGFTLPAEGFTGTPDIPCPEVGDQARAYWATWATSSFAHFFGPVEWQNLSDSTLLMERFYSRGDMTAYREARMQASMLFGLAIRAKLHVTAESEDDTTEATGNLVRAANRRKG